jgi:hypothetical protein
VLELAVVELPSGSAAQPRTSMHFKPVGIAVQTGAQTMGGKMRR